MNDKSILLKLRRSGGWLTGALILLLPVSLIFFLGSQMAYGQVKGKFEAYAQIPEISHLAGLKEIPAGQPVLLRGQLLALDPAQSTGANYDLIVFREKPAEGREVRFKEEFPQYFPQVRLSLEDGIILIQPSLTQEAIIQHELHTIPSGDRDHSGFRAGDLVTVQGKWQPGETPLLQEVTGLSSLDKDGLLQEWQTAFRQVAWARNGLGLLSLLSLGLLLVRLRQAKKYQSGETEEWTNPTTGTIPTA